MLRPLLTMVVHSFSLQTSQAAMFRLCHALFSTVAMALIATALSPASTLAQDGAAPELSVHPMRVDLPASASTRQLTLKNTGDQDLSLKLRLIEWPEGNELFPRIARGLLVTPMMLTLPANSTRDIRIGRLRDTSPPDVEQSYHLLISGDSSAEQELSVPVFIPPLQRQTEAPQVATQKLEAGLSITINNNGNSHLHISELQLQERDGTPLKDTALDLYIPAGRSSSHTWQLDTSSVPAAAMLKLTINQREFLHALR